MTERLGHVHVAGQTETFGLKKRTQLLDELGEEHSVCAHTSLDAPPDVDRSTKGKSGKAEKLDGRHRAEQMRVGAANGSRLICARWRKIHSTIYARGSFKRLVGSRSLMPAPKLTPMTVRAWDTGACTGACRTSAGFSNLARQCGQSPCCNTVSCNVGPYRAPDPHRSLLQ